jgi:hypothetical protein
MGRNRSTHWMQIALFLSLFEVGVVALMAVVGLVA